MLDAGVAAILEHVEESDDVGVDVGARVLERVAHARLGGEVDDALGRVLGEAPVHQRAVLEVAAHLGEALVRLDALEPRELQRGVVVVVDVVDADDLVAAFEQPDRERRADEPGRAGDENLHGG